MTRVSTAAIALFLHIACIAACDADLRDERGWRSARHRLRGIELPGDTNGVSWDPTTATLYLTDETHAQLVAWTERGGFHTVAAFPAHARPGSVVRIPDGRFVTASSIYGVDGAMFVDGARLPVDPDRRRNAVVVVGGAIYATYFELSSAGSTGGVVRIGPDGREVEIVTGLRRPVGLAASDTTLYVSDEELGAIFTAPLAGGEPSPLATVARAGMLTLLPDGDLVATTARGVVARVTPSGGVAIIADGFEQLRGTAYDAANRRLFVIEHSAWTSHHHLHVLSLDGGEGPTS